MDIRYLWGWSRWRFFLQATRESQSCCHFGPACTLYNIIFSVNPKGLGLMKSTKKYWKMLKIINIAIWYIIDNITHINCWEYSMPLRYKPVYRWWRYRALILRMNLESISRFPCRSHHILAQTCRAVTYTTSFSSMKWWKLQASAMDMSPPKRENWRDRQVRCRSKWQSISQRLYYR